VAVDDFDKLRGLHLFGPDDAVPAALAGGHLEALWLPQAGQPPRPAEREITLCL